MARRGIAPTRPELALPYYVSEIVYAAETARDNDKVVPGPGYEARAGTDRSLKISLPERTKGSVIWECGCLHAGNYASSSQAEV